jgi:hypothetical protein
VRNEHDSDTTKGTLCLLYDVRGQRLMEERSRVIVVCDQLFHKDNESQPPSRFKTCRSS